MFWKRYSKAFEYRFQNISQVLALQGRDWLPGLVPARNVGAKVIARIEGLLARAERVANRHVAAFEAQVQSLRHPKQTQPPPPEGSASPSTQKSSATSFHRDPADTAPSTRRERLTFDPEVERH